MSEVGLGVTLGVIIALLHTGAGLGLYRWAFRLPARKSVGILVAVVLGRLVVALLAVALVLWTVPVDRTAFVVALFGSVAAGLVLEVTLIHRSDSLG